MKANKALKRLAKIEALISDLTERYSRGAVEVRKGLQDAKVAFARVKAAVSSQTSSKPAKNPAAKTKKAAAKKTAAKARGAAAALAPSKKARTMSVAQRKKQAERMKAFWTAKRQAAVKAKPAASRQPRKIAPHPVITPAPVQVAPQDAGTDSVTGEVERATGTDLPANAFR